MRFFLTENDEAEREVDFREFQAAQKDDAVRKARKMDGKIGIPAWKVHFRIDMSNS